MKATWRAAWHKRSVSNDALYRGISAYQKASGVAWHRNKARRSGGAIESEHPAASSKANMRVSMAYQA